MSPFHVGVRCSPFDQRHPAQGACMSTYPESDEDHSKRSRIGFVIPTNGALPLILETLDSIDSQSLAPARVVVVFDGLNDDIRSLVESHPVEVVIITLEEASGGPATPRNIGFDRIRDECDAVCFLDHDDILHPDFVRLATAMLEAHADASVVSFPFENWLDGTPRGALETLPASSIATTSLELSDYLGATGSVLPSFTVVRNEIAPIVRDAGTVFSADFPSNQDFESFVRILSQRPGVRCDWKAGWYRVISTSISANGGFSWECRSNACESLSKWFAGRNDRFGAGAFRRAAGTANRRSARHYWAAGERMRSLRMLVLNILRHRSVRDLVVMMSLLLGVDSKSRGMSSVDQRQGKIC
ncbi:MAG TPA: hypothetical protein DCX60_04680 [Phycisphaerales bacterium]|nr:hypothetical protein [Phycisphaerales bacterium]